MKNCALLIMAALLVSAFAGCSKHPTATTPPKVTDLGVIEVSDGSTNRLDIGGGRVCVVRSFTSKSLRGADSKDNLKPNQIVMVITVEEKDASGATHILTTENLIALSGQQVGFQEPSIAISVTPHLKP